MDVPDEIAEYLRRDFSKAVCDRCLQVSLGLTRTQHVQQIVNAFKATGVFTRTRGRCSVCGNVQFVNQALPFQVGG